MDGSRKLNGWKGGDGSMVDLLRRRLRSKRGQSILEYVVITTVVVLAILAIRAAVTTNTNALYNESANKINAGATLLTNVNFANPH